MSLVDLYPILMTDSPFTAETLSSLAPPCLLESFSNCQNLSVISMKHLWPAFLSPFLDPTPSLVWMFSSAAHAQLRTILTAHPAFSTVALPTEGLPLLQLLCSYEPSFD